MNIKYISKFQESLEMDLRSWNAWKTSIKRLAPSVAQPLGAVSRHLKVIFKERVVRLQRLMATDAELNRSRTRWKDILPF